MARKSINELAAQAIANFPDNITGDVSPADLRQFCLDFLEAISPAYGYLTKTTGSSQLLGLTPVVVDFTAGFDSDPTQTTSSAANNNITRSERGTCTMNFSCDFETNSGRFITFTIFKNSSATPWRVTGNGAGAGNPVSVALTAVDYADPAAIYDVRATAELANTTTTLSDIVLLLSVDPVKSYT